MAPDDQVESGLDAGWGDEPDPEDARTTAPPPESKPDPAPSVRARIQSTPTPLMEISAAEIAAADARVVALLAQQHPPNIDPKLASAAAEELDPAVLAARFVAASVRPPAPVAPTRAAPQSEPDTTMPARVVSVARPPTPMTLAEPTPIPSPSPTNARLYVVLALVLLVAGFVANLLLR